jgi:alpha-L-fucosidase
MYAQFAPWHTEHYGPRDTFGYKDFIPMFKAESYDPAARAALFRRAVRGPGE